MIIWYESNLISSISTLSRDSTIDQSSVTGEKGSKFDSSRDRYVWLLLEVSDILTICDSRHAIAKYMSEIPMPVVLRFELYCMFVHAW